MNKDKHVYCTEYVYGKKLINNIINNTNIPIPCQNCYSYYSEDSIKFQDRPNYIDLIQTTLDGLIFAAEDMWNKLDENTANKIINKIADIHKEIADFYNNTDDDFYYKVNLD